MKILRVLGVGKAESEWLKKASCSEALTFQCGYEVSRQVVHKFRFPDTAYVMQCIIQFTFDRDWIEFRLLELDALLQLNGVDVDSAYNKDEYHIDNPSLRITLPNEEVAINICQRSILIKHIFEFWGGTMCGGDIDK